VRAFILRRLLRLVPVLLAVSCLAMFIIDLAPGDFLTELRANPQISQSAVERMRVEFGLDRHWFVQYLLWLKRAVLGFDLGESFSYRAPVSRLIAERVGNTLLLALTASLFAWSVAIPLGVAAAARRGTWIDRAHSAIATLGLSVPRVLLALLVLYVSATTGIFPVGGMRNPATHDQLSAWGRAVDIGWHLVPPALVMGVAGIAQVARQMRASMLDALGADCVRTARAKGLSEGRVVLRHALPSALNPMITLFGLTLARLLSTSLVVEAVMAWPGLGSLTLEAIRRQDLYVVMATLVMASVLLVIGNLIADILLAATDPRVAPS
jgi:peptide/nickel transport system permease protein